MLGDNIRMYRKSKQMSQDELAEKLNVTRQSISLWETGQTQPSLDNIIALAKLFDVSTDALLTDTVSLAEPAANDVVTSNSPKKSRRKKSVLIIFCCVALVSAVLIFVLLWNNGVLSDGNQKGGDSAFPVNYGDEKTDQLNTEDITQQDSDKTIVKNNKDDSQMTITENQVDIKPEANATDNNASVSSETKPVIKPVTNEPTNNVDCMQSTVTENKEVADETVNKRPIEDIYSYLKNFVVQNGTLNGDYCFYSKTADNYGGYASEEFSLYYWGDTDTVEFCLHSVMDETFSINFYLRVPKANTGEYEYISSYYYRDTGEALYEAKGTISGAEFSKNYPLKCDKYIGSPDIQTDFMEMSRLGVCDLIDCIKNFVSVESLELSFTDFGFVDF